MIPNPLARHRRLGAALLQLRESRGYTHAKLAALCGLSTSPISRIENPFADLSRRPDPEIVRQILDALDIPADSDEYQELTQLAAVAAGRGWWTGQAYAQMGKGQRDAAIVELGAEIREYAGILLPGLVQTADAARHRIVGPNVDPIVAGRMERQRRIADSTYHLVVEPQAVHRWSVPDRIALDQLHHLLKLAERPNFSIRILRQDAQLGEGVTLRGPFSHFSYGDTDPPIVGIDEVAHVRLITDRQEVEEYAQLHKRLYDAAMSDADTVALIREVADSLADRI